jgi:hypothetical protein
LVGNSHEARRMEETPEGSQDSVGVVVPMMMILLYPCHLPGSRVSSYEGSCNGVGQWGAGCR